ncbi:hypothetical protein [Paenibacillus sp. JDR-2]|uniref:hypothetical protein n=1 Tax=Paenibacillus sp. (strain JDR-2) TaxID=324057 RepID=UPI0001667AE2|nr:hypothetical protein [Paenibacillus sp. JDR-2]ACT02341.1 hypothetical protein Pjdr2_3710 [Paenibacillus sp. JDR-2]
MEIAKRAWMITVSLAAVLIFLFLAQNKKIEMLRLQLNETNRELKEKEDEISSTKSEMDTKKKEMLKVTYNLELERKASEEKNKVLNEQLQQADAMVFANVSQLFGDHAPVVDSSVTSEILSTITNLFEAMQKNDAAKFAELDKKGVLTSFYKQRDKVEKILWIQNDPDKRAEAVKEWLEINHSDMKLIKVFYFMKDGSIIEPNYAMVRENGKWIILRED